MKNTSLFLVVMCSLMCCGMAQAVVVADLQPDLLAGWSDTDRGGAVGIADRAGGSYTVCWLDGNPVQLPTSTNNNIMGGWGWPDNGGATRYAWGYSWNGTHDSGWAGAYVGFEVTGTTMKYRSNGNWNAYYSAPGVVWTSGVAGTATFTFAIGTSVNSGALFGIYDYQTGTWASANGGDDLFTDTPNAILRPDASSYSNVEEAGSMTFVKNIAVGDKFMFAARCGTWKNGFDNLPWTAANVDVIPIPEPATMLILGLGAAALRIRRK